MSLEQQTTELLFVLSFITFIKVFYFYHYLNNICFRDDLLGFLTQDHIYEYLNLKLNGDTSQWMMKH